MTKLIKALDTTPGLGKPITPAADQWKSQLRQRLQRRLLWKIPLIILLVGFAVWWQWRNELEPPLSTAEQTAAAKIAAAVSGTWSGEVTYPWGDKYTERFLFNAEGTKLFGTATFLAAKRAIEEGQITGETILFRVSYKEMAGGDKSTRLNHYEGQLSGGKIRLRVFDDKGGAPAEFNLVRSGDAGRAVDTTTR